MLLNTLSRVTHDIDALEISHQLQGLISKYDINTQVNSYISNFPYGFEDRLVLLFRGRKVDFYTASLEDIVISKLQSSRDTDMRDITSQGVLEKINWEELQNLATDENETKASALNDFQYTVFMGKYEDYVRRFKDERTDL